MVFVITANFGKNGTTMKAYIPACGDLCGFKVSTCTALRITSLSLMVVEIRQFENCQKLKVQPLSGQIL